MDQPRMENPALVVPGALEALQALGHVTQGGGVPHETLAMVTLRASQINGCSVCVDIHTRELEAFGTSAERIHLVAAWRDAPYFSDSTSEARRHFQVSSDANVQVGARRGAQNH